MIGRIALDMVEHRNDQSNIAQGAKIAIAHGTRLEKSSKHLGLWQQQALQHTRDELRISTSYTRMLGEVMLEPRRLPVEVHHQRKAHLVDKT